MVLIVLTAVVLGVVFYGWELGQSLLAAVGFKITSPFVLASIQWVTILAVLLIACEVIYNVVPSFKKFRWNWINVGTFVAIGLWILFTGLFRLYLHYYNTYNKTYGSLGAVIILMLWLYLTALAVMIGATINAVLRQVHLEDTSATLPTAEDQENPDPSQTTEAAPTR